MRSLAIRFLLVPFAVLFAIACTILALLGVGGCKKVSDPVVADSTYVRGLSLEPPRLILESHAP